MQALPLPVTSIVIKICPYGVYVLSMALQIQIKKAEMESFHKTLYCDSKHYIMNSCDVHLCS